MKRLIRGADYIKYNANNRGKNVGDCVKRALSLAFDMSYNDMAKLLNAQAKELNGVFNNPIVYRCTINDLVHEQDPEASTRWTILKGDDQLTLDDFVDKYCQSGTYLIETGHKQGDNNTTHILCVIDGKIYDSWDSRDQWVKEYYKVPIKTRRNFQENVAGNPDLGMLFADQIDDQARKCISRYRDKKQAEWASQVTDIEVDRVKWSGYQVYTLLRIVIGPRSYRNQTSKYTYKIVAVLHPQDTFSDAEKIIVDTIKTRVYDRIWAVNKNEAEKEDMYRAEQEQGGQVELSIFGPRSMSFFKSLPAWAKAACSYISVQYPGRYTDSYQVTLQEPGTGKDLEFYAPTADILRQELDLYESEGILPGKDYDLTGMFDW